MASPQDRSSSGTPTAISWSFAGVIGTLAGNGTVGFSGDGGPATSAQFVVPLDVSVDATGNLFIADQGNYRIRQVNAAGVINSRAGTSDDGRPASFAQFFFPNTVAADGAGNVFVADTDMHRIRKINPAGIMTMFAGNGSAGFSEMADRQPLPNFTIRQPSH